jgi:hypothetical protein
VSIEADPQCGEKSSPLYITRPESGLTFSIRKRIEDFDPWSLPPGQELSTNRIALRLRPLICPDAESLSGNKAFEAPSFGAVRTLDSCRIAI